MKKPLRELRGYERLHYMCRKVSCKHAGSCTRPLGECVHADIPQYRDREFTYVQLHIEILSELVPAFQDGLLELVKSLDKQGSVNDVSAKEPDKEQKRASRAICNALTVGLGLIIFTGFWLSLAWMFGRALR
jgi:hypothetical protein